MAVATAAAVLLSSLVASPAFAQEEETDTEGGTKSLRDTLDEAAEVYQDAKGILDASEDREAELVAELEDLEDQRDAVVAEVQVSAVTAYRSGRIGPITALLNSSSPTDFLERATALEVLTQRENDQLVELGELTESVAEQQALIAEEIALQEEEVAKLEAAVEKAEEALFAIGGGASGQFEAFPAEDAQPAPRNPDGSLPGEGCTEADPTTSGGCLTSRMLHAYNEARLFGFNRHTSCWRSGDFGEHPVGRACDFSAHVGTFGGVATGSDKTYGDRLASFLVHNADALAVQYVIWYRQIWFPGTGWRSYGGAGGDASSDHTNHVHLSVR